MTVFQMKVLEAVRTCPGMRARYLPLNAWVCDVAHALWELEDMGMVKSQSVLGDHGCVDSYLIWYPV